MPDAQWQPIETAPRDGTPFLAALDNGAVVFLHAPHNADKPRARYLWWVGPTMSIPIADTHPADTPWDRPLATHWMPLPEPPHG